MGTCIRSAGRPPYPWVGPQALDPTPVPHQWLIADEHFQLGVYAYFNDEAASLVSGYVAVHQK
jgi:hypothetical protein